MMKMAAALFGTTLASLAIVGGAQADTVTETYDFTLGNFVDTSGNNVTAPISSITGSFTLTFDPAASVNLDYSIVVNSFSASSTFITNGSPLAFYTDPSGYNIGIGTTNPNISEGYGVGYLFYGNNDFVLQLLFANANSLGNPQLTTCADPGFSCANGSGLSSFLSSGYSLASNPNDIWFATTGSVSATPLPATLPLFATGFGALGLLGWRRKRQNATAVAA